jgi:hypothetical protein|tara:strand:- start:1742 stop:2026 length:285 start_codon:yes stop_codon:yes gene_type:complete
MATIKRALGMCDECGFVYPQRIMRLSSYNTLRCPTCFDGRYDLKNHPQNQSPDVSEDPAIRNARPDDLGRNKTWDQADFTWESDTPVPNFWDSV